MSTENHAFVVKQQKNPSTTWNLTTLQPYKPHVSQSNKIVMTTL